MPTRMIRDWTDSMRFDGLSADAERLFVRLIMKADDYGRFHADPRLLKASCFPLLDNLRPHDLTRWLDELSHRQLILRYEAEGRSCLVILNYGQRLKNSRAKFPPAPGESDDWLPLPGSSGKFREVPARREEKRRDLEMDLEDEVEGENTPPAPPAPQGGRRARFAPPSIQDVQEYGETLDPPFRKAEKFVAHYESNGWRVGKNPMKDWRAAVRTWNADTKPEPPAHRQRGYNEQLELP